MKSVQVSPSASVRLSSGSSSRGVLLGSSWDSRVQIQFAVGTPPVPTSWRADEWFVEHARQVKRMLVGGVELIGAYVNEKDPSSKDEGVLRDLIYSLPITSPSMDRILLKSIGSKLTCDVFIGLKKDGLKSKNVSQLKVMDFQTQVICLQTNIAIDITLPVASTNVATLKAQVKKAFETLHAKLLTAPAFIDGAAVDTSLVLEKAIDASATSSSSKSKQKRAGGSSKSSKKDVDDSSSSSPHDVEFFFLPPAMPAVDSPEGVIRIKGACHARTYAHNKYTVGQALTLLCESSDDPSGGFALPTSMPFFTWSLPRRLMVALAAGGAVCDYLLPDEHAADGIDRIEELIGVTKADRRDEAGGEGEDIMERCEHIEPTAHGERQKRNEENQTNTQNENTTATTTTATTTTAGSQTSIKKDSSDNMLMLVGLVVVAVGISIAFLQLM